MKSAPPVEGEPIAAAVTDAVTVAESRGSGSDGSDDGAEESPLAGPRGLGTMTGRAPGTTAIIAGVRLASHKVNVVIRDGLARTEVEETFENTTARVLEGRYVFPVPPDASVSRLALYVGNELVEGEIVERERAARIFKGIVEDTVRPRDPALLEWVKGSEVSLEVFPLPAHGARKIVIAHDQVLSEASSQVRYLYPLSLGQDRAVTIDELSIDVTAADATTSLVGVRTPGYAATTAPSGPLHVGFSAHAFTPAGDFILEYERAPSTGPDVSAHPAPTSGAGEIGKKVVAEDGYLTMRLPIVAPAVTRARTSHDRAIVLDVSQSQSKETLAGEIAVARGLLRRLDGESASPCSPATAPVGPFRRTGSPRPARRQSRTPDAGSRRSRSADRRISPARSSRRRSGSDRIGSRRADCLSRRRRRERGRAHRRDDRRARAAGDRGPQDRRRPQQRDLSHVDRGRRSGDGVRRHRAHVRRDAEILGPARRHPDRGCHAGVDPRAELRTRLRLAVIANHSARRRRAASSSTSSSLAKQKRVSVSPTGSA